MKDCQLVPLYTKKCLYIANKTVTNSKYNGGTEKCACSGIGTCACMMILIIIIIIIILYRQMKKYLQHLEINLVLLPAVPK